MEKGRKKQQLLLMTALLGLTLLVVGVSYAAYSYFGIGQTENLVRTGNLTFNYDEKESTNQLSLTNAFPETDEKGKTQENYFDFDVDASTKGAPIYYEIYLTKVDSSTLPEKVVKTYLTTLNGDNETEVVDPLNNNAINFYNELGYSKVPNQTFGKTLYQEMIPEGESNYHKTFRYRMWLDENATKMNINGEWIYNHKTFTVRVNVYASNEEIGKPIGDLPRMKSYAKVNESGQPASTGEDFHAAEWKDNIIYIVVYNRIEMPEDILQQWTVLQQWDVSETGDGSVIAWLVDTGMGNDEVPAYILVIAGEGGVSAPVNSSCLFANMNGLRTIDLTYLDTSDVTNMSYMFAVYRGEGTADSHLQRISFGEKFDTSKVTDMSNMFGGCQSLTNLDVSNFDTSNVTNMGYMFSGCRSLTNLDVSNFDTSNVTNMISMFNGCRVLTKLDVSNFDTSNVIDMRYMFGDCRSVISLDVSNFDTSNVTDMYYMFYYCNSLASLDVSNFDTSNVTDMRDMFSGCSSLTSLDLSNFDTSNVASMGSMFNGCGGLTSLDVSSFDTLNVEYMGSMFYGCSGLTSLDVSSFDTSNVTGMGYMFSGCSSLTSLDLSNFDTSNVVDMHSMFAQCSSLTSVDFRSATFKADVNVSRMFSSVPTTITVIVKDTAAQTLIQNALGSGKGTVTIAGQA